ncbi:MAG: hypothetical protein ACUVTG_07915, partial [Candidatus Oleimicrobiaceae bacterium]
MQRHSRIFATLFLVAMAVTLTQLPVWAEGPGKNMVIAAGETWCTYIPANYDYPWPRLAAQTDVKAFGYSHPQACIFMS